MTAVLALSIGSKVDHYGALAGVAAIVGIGVLAVLYAAQAREVKRLREWAGRAPERDADLQQRVVAEAQRRAAVPAPVQPVPRTQPATAAGAPAAAAPPAAQLPGPATPAAVPAAVAAAAAAGAVTAPAAAQAAGTAPPAQKPPVGAPAAPAASPGAPAPGAVPAKPASPVPAATPVVAAAAAGAAAAKPAAGAPPATTPPAVTPTSTAGPTAPAAPPSTPAQPPGPAAAAPAATAPAATAPATPAAASQPTAVVPPAAPPRPRASAAAPLRTTAREAAAASPPPGHARRNLAVVIFGGIAIAAIAVLLITQVFNGGDAGPEPKPNTVAAPGQTTGAETTAGGSLPPIDRAATTVSVLNGTAVQGLARGASTKLTTRGYTEGIVKTNTNQQVPTTTVYYVRGSNRQARDVARILGLGAGVAKPMDPAVQALAGNAPVVVVVGLDQAQ